MLNFYIDYAIDVGVPLQVVRLIAIWFSKVIMTVNWENCYSSSCTGTITSGVIQGSVLSLVLSSVYSMPL